MDEMAQPLQDMVRRDLDEMRKDPCGCKDHERLRQDLEYMLDAITLYATELAAVRFWSKAKTDRISTLTKHISSLEDTIKRMNAFRDGKEYKEATSRYDGTYGTIKNWW